MRCSRTERLFTPYLDDRLEAAERRDVEAHLAACANCRSTFEVLRGARAALAAAGPARPPEGFAARVARAAVRAPRAEQPTSFAERLFPLAWPAAMASVTAALALVFFVGRAGPVGGLEELTSADPMEGVAASLEPDRMVAAVVLEEVE